MEHFNFLGLPDVVQDLVVHEIVHNSIPNDRIQLARTCKYLNEAVKRSKPKKIVEKLEIIFFNYIHFEIGTKSFESLPTPEFFTSICQILQQIQVEKLSVVSTPFGMGETQDSGLFHHFSEALKFVTELEFFHDGFFPEFTEFYSKLEHVEFLNFGGSIDMFNSLSHYPSRIRLNTLPNYDSSLLENITKKSVNNPLSSLYLDNFIPLEDLQQFLQTTKFKNGCEIHSEVQNSAFDAMHIFMTFIDDEQGFEIETFLKESPLIVANQNCDVKEKRIFTLSPVELPINFESLQNSRLYGIPFNVTMKTQPTLPIL